MQLECRPIKPIKNAHSSVYSRRPAIAIKFCPKPAIPFCWSSGLYFPLLSLLFSLLFKVAFKNFISYAFSGCKPMHLPSGAIQTRLCICLCCNPQCQAGVYLASDCHNALTCMPCYGAQQLYLPKMTTVKPMLLCFQACKRLQILGQH